MDAAKALEFISYFWSLRLSQSSPPCSVHKTQWTQSTRDTEGTQECRFLSRGYLLCVVQLLSCVSLFCDPMDCSQPGSSVHRGSPVRIVEWVAIFFSRGSFQLRDGTHISLCLLHWQVDSLPLYYPGSPDIYCQYASIFCQENKYILFAMRLSCKFCTSKEEYLVNKLCLLPCVTFINNTHVGVLLSQAVTSM